MMTAKELTDLTVEMLGKGCATPVLTTRDVELAELRRSLSALRRDLAMCVTEQGAAIIRGDISRLEHEIREGGEYVPGGWLYNFHGLPLNQGAA